MESARDVTLSKSEDSSRERGSEDMMEDVGESKEVLRDGLSLRN